jgi:two-component system phosphate regulon sensor histidine kinase PhoR
VKHILTRHRGRLTVRSQLGKGSVFTVVFAGS